jgi:NAD-dependent deacetylase
MTMSRRVLVLTGAGVSAPSGLPTFRGPQGLYEDREIEALHHVDALPASAGRLWEVWGPVRTELRRTAPSPAHIAIARFQRLIESAGGTCLVVTPNVDGLHQRAGYP